MSVLFTRRGMPPTGGTGGGGISGTLASDLAVGTSVFLNVDGVSTEFLIVHQGKPSSIYDTSCDSTWLLMKDACTTMAWDSTNNDYENSDVHSYLSDTFFNMLDSSVKACVKTVKLPYQKGTGSGGSIASGASGLSVQIFLLSGYEMGWTTAQNQYFPIDGAKLSYFDSGTSTTANSKRIAYYNKSAVSWWLRSPATGSTQGAWYADTSGTHYFSYSGSELFGIRPALILPSNSMFDPTTMEFIGLEGDNSGSSGNEGEVPSEPTTFTVSITNNSKTLMGIEMSLVKINGVTYGPSTMSSGETITLSVSPGTVVSCEGAGQDDAIFLDGQVVLDSAEGTAQYYNYTVNSNTNIELGYTSYPSGGTVKITTNV